MKKYEKPKLEEEIIEILDVVCESTVDGDSEDWKVGGLNE